VVDNDQASGALPTTVSTRLTRQPGGSGGKTLAINILQIAGKPKLVMMSATSARFNSRCVCSGTCNAKLLDAMTGTV
jgi:hypothetical protein